MSSVLSFEPLSLLSAIPAQVRQAFPLSIKVFGPSDEKRAIYALRYRAFRQLGVIDPRDDGLFFDRYDDLATSWSIGAFSGLACIGSMRLTFGDGQSPSMPCQEVFPEVETLSDRGYGNLVEFTRLAVCPSLTNTSYRATLYGALVRAGTMMAHAGDVDYALMSTHPDKTRLYTTLCGFEVIAHADDYPGINAPAVLLGRDFRALDRKRSSRNPFFSFSKSEIASARAALSSSSCVPDGPQPQASVA